MPKVRGREAVNRYFANAPERLMRIATGAARAGAKVIQEGAVDLCRSERVQAAIKTATRRDGLVVRGLVHVKGTRWVRARAEWLEHGTAPHFISVDDSQRGGRSISRINRQAKDEGDHSLVIGGKFVGRTVLHPGATAHPFMRTSLDLNGREALAAAQAHIDNRGRRSQAGEDAA